MDLHAEGPGTRPTMSAATAAALKPKPLTTTAAAAPWRADKECCYS